MKTRRRWFRRIALTRAPDNAIQTRDPLPGKAYLNLVSGDNR